MNDFAPVKLDDYEYGEVRFLNKMSHDGDRLTVTANLGDHGTIMLAENYDDETAEVHGGCIIIWPEDLPTIVKALIASYNYQTLWHKLELVEWDGDA